MRYVIAFAAFMWGCSYGPTFLGCDEPDPVVAIETVKEEWPSASDTIDSMDWFCQTRDDLQFDYDCYTMWRGGNLSYARGRSYSDLAEPLNPCFVHESWHWAQEEEIVDSDPRFDQEEITRVIELVAERMR